MSALALMDFQERIAKYFLAQTIRANTEALARSAGHLINVIVKMVSPGKIARRHLVPKTLVKMAVAARSSVIPINVSVQTAFLVKTAKLHPVQTTLAILGLVM